MYRLCYYLNMHDSKYCYSVSKCASVKCSKLKIACAKKVLHEHDIACVKQARPEDTHISDSHIKSFRL